MLRRLIFNFEEIFGVIFLAIMATVAFLNVITRYVLKYSMAFTEELTVYLFVWTTLLGVSLAFREGSNVAVSLVYNRFGKGARKVIYVFAALCSIGFFAVFTYLGILEVIEEVGLRAMTEAMELPMWIFTVSMPLAGTLTIIRVIIRTKNDLKSGNW